MRHLRSIKDQLAVGGGGGGDVTSVFGRTGAVIANASDYDANQVDFAPAGSLAATDVQAALEELDSEKAAASHTHSAADIVSGSFADARIAETNVTQHESAIDHDALLNFSIDEHRTINDSGSSTTDLWSASKITSELDTHAPAENGFVDKADSTISFVDATRTFTIAPAVSSFDYFQGSLRYTKSSADNVVISDVEGSHWIYYDGSTLTETTTFTIDIIVLYAFVATVYWDATNKKAVLLSEERHGNIMDSQTHSYNHQTYGARYQDGLDLGDITADGDGSSNTHAQLSVADGKFWDEDLQHVIADGSPQELSPIAQLPILYRDGVNGDWRKIAATDFPVTTTGTGRAAWNEWTGSTWQLSEAAANNIVLMHIFATNDINEPMVSICGQNSYNSLKNAHLGAQTEISELSFGGLQSATQEFIPVATVLFETKNTYTNSVKSRIITTEDGSDYIDWRERTVSGSQVSVTDHGNLTGLTDDDHTQYLLVNGTRAMSAALDMGAFAITNVGNVDGRDVSADGTKLDGIESGAEVNDVTSVFGRVGAVVADQNDYATYSQDTNGMVPGYTSGQSLYWLNAGSGWSTLPVTATSVFGRTGAVTAQASDYDANQVDFTPDGDISASDVQAAIVEVRDETDIKLSSKANLSHTHLATDIVSGTFNDARVAQSNVTQHEAAINHDALTNFVADEHLTPMKGTWYDTSVYAMSTSYAVMQLDTEFHNTGQFTHDAANEEIDIDEDRDLTVTLYAEVQKTTSNANFTTTFDIERDPGTGTFALQWRLRIGGRITSRKESGSTSYSFGFSAGDKIRVRAITDTSNVNITYLALHLSG